MNAVETEERMAQLDEDIDRLRQKIMHDQRERALGFSLFDTNSAQQAPRFEFVSNNMKVTRNLEGHFGKIYSMQWGPQSKRIVSAGQDGKLIVWQADLGFKHHMINLRSSWVMCCAYSPDGKFVASGGLDNICSIYSVPEEPQMTENRDNVTGFDVELVQHVGYLSCIRYVNSNTLLTSSGDSTVMLWDVEDSQQAKEVFSGHNDDVMCVSVVGDDKNLFLSGSVDTTAKLWDVRQKNSALTFYGHESDVNSIASLPGGNAFVTACEDAAIRMFDIRAQASIAQYKVDTEQSRQILGVTSVAVTKSGRGLVASYDDENILVWDTLKGTISQELKGHTTRVAAVDVSPDGKAVCSVSWDYLVKVWA